MSVISGISGGANFQYYADRASDIYGLDANPAAQQYAKSTAENLQIPPDKLHLMTGRAEELPFNDAFFDVVVCTHVLCSVQDQSAALRECKRVLKPGGKFYFLEHVAAAPESTLLTAQKALQPIWHHLGDGCSLTRNTGAAIQEAGFQSVSLDKYAMEMPFMLRIVSHHVSGVCTK